MSGHAFSEICSQTNVLTGSLIAIYPFCCLNNGKGSRTYSITERRVPELIPVLGSQPAGGVSHKPGGRPPLLSATPTVTSATPNRAVTNFAV